MLNRFAVDLELIRLPFRKRATSERTPYGERNSLFIKNVAEARAGAAPSREWPAAGFYPDGFAIHVTDVAREILAVVDEPAQPFAKAGQAVEHFLIEHFDGEQRNQPDQRTDAQRSGRLSFDQKLIVIKAVLLVPQPVAADGVHRVDDLHEMLEELRRDVFVSRVGERQFARHRKHRRAVKRHPCGAIRLGERLPARQRPRTVEEPDVIEAEKAAGEDVAPLDVLAIDPPGEVEQQLLETALEKECVAAARRSR